MEIPFFVCFILASFLSDKNDAESGGLFLSLDLRVFYDSKNRFTCSANKKFCIYIRSTKIRVNPPNMRVL